MDGDDAARRRPGRQRHDLRPNEAGGSVVAVRQDAVAQTFADVTQPAGVAHVGTSVGLLDVQENT